MSRNSRRRAHLHFVEILTVLAAGALTAVARTARARVVDNFDIDPFVAELVGD